MNCNHALAAVLLALAMTLALPRPSSLAATGAPAPGGPVTIDRDEWGVPHIYAATEEGGYFGLGYAMSEDRFERLMQMVLLERGELASLAGASRLDADIQSRMWLNRRMAEAGLSQMSPQLRRNYAAFAAGVRQYAARTHPRADLAALARSLTLVDMVAIPRALIFVFDHPPYAQVECGVNDMSYSRGMLPYKTTERSPASNGWVVMPKRTASGALILASDPHVETSSIGYYEFEMQAADLHVSGYAMGPALWQVHNNDVSWALTQGNPDFLDCYAVQTDPSDPRVYRYDGKPHRMEVRQETFKVAGGPDVERAFEYVSMNGMPAPVIARRGGTAFVASAADMGRAGYLNQTFYDMDKARSVGDIKRAFASMSGMSQNVVAGDRAGHVLYIRVGRAPIRPRGYDWTKPVPGNSSATAWTGYRSVDELVQLRDPVSGFLQSDNAAPDRVTVGADDPRASDYAADLFFDMPGRQTSRGARTLQVLQASQHISLDDALALAFDEMWISAPDWIAALRYAQTARPDLVSAGSPAMRAAMTRLLAFDGQAHSDSEAALDFYLWRNAADAKVATLQAGGFIHSPWKPRTFDTELATVLLTSLSKSVAARVAAHGDVPLRLGDVVRAVRGDQDYPVGGITINSAAAPLCVEEVRAICERTMRAFRAAAYGNDGRLRITGGSQAMRMVEFTEPLRAYSLYAFGESDDPASPHYADQTRLFSEKTMKRAYFSKAELQGHIASEETLSLSARRLGIVSPADRAPPK